MNPTKFSYVVFDTNALISAAILPHSVSRKALLAACANFRIVHSPDTWQELFEVIRRKKFDKYFISGWREEFFITLARLSEFIETSATVDDCPDPSDNKFLELAMDTEAEWIVSGDGHLCNMNPYRGIKIVPPADFLKTCNRMSLVRTLKETEESGISGFSI